MGAIRCFSAIFHPPHERNCKMLQFTKRLLHSSGPVYASRPCPRSGAYFACSIPGWTQQLSRNSNLKNLHHKTLSTQPFLSPQPHLIRLSQLLKFQLGCWVVWVFVRVVLPSQFVVLLLNLGIICIPMNLQESIIIVLIIVL